MASTTVDTLITRYVLDDSAHHRGSRRVVRDTKDIGAAQDRAKTKTKSFVSDMNTGFSKFQSVLTAGFTAATAFTGIMVGLAAAILSASWAAASKAADFEALEASLRAVSKNAQEAKKDLRDLTQIAKMPGIDIEGAIKGLVGLKFAGLDSGRSKEIISQAGNANAVAGGGRAQFEAIMRALKQIAGKEFLQGDELLQLSEAGMPATAWIKEAFGTADTEKLKKAGIDSALVLDVLTVAMSNLERASGGAKNQIENLAIAADQAQIGFGKGIISGLFGEMDSLTDALTDLVDAGVFKWFGETIAGDIGSALGMVDTGDLAESMIRLMGKLVDVAAATRNFFMQLGNVIEALLGPVGKLLVGGLKNLSGGEGARFVETGMGMLDAYRATKTKRDEERATEEVARKAKLEVDRGAIEDRRKEGKEKVDALGDDTKKIKENTRRTAVASERALKSFESAVFGGSELGKMGISPREMKQIKGGSGSGGGGGKIAQAVTLIEEALAESMGLAIKVQMQYQR